MAERYDDVDAVVMVDTHGLLVDDIPVVNLFVADPDQPIGELASPTEPITVTPDATLSDVVDRFIDSRRSSVLVVDDDGHPIGRILADDVIDALVPHRGRHRLPLRMP
jgi:CBS domain-containing protein